MGSIPVGGAIFKCFYVLPFRFWYNISRYVPRKGENMALENKLKIIDFAELAREEERISKTRAIELFETDFLSSLIPGTFEALSKIHAFLFSDIYDFAGRVRTVNTAKGILDLLYLCICECGTPF